MKQNLTGSQRDALSYDKHIAVTANAGSGKTFVLAQRLRKILSENNRASLKDIAIITFTEKAAAELYKKIGDMLDEQILASDNPEEKERFTNSRKQLVSAEISTIDSFCSSILREFPVEAEVDAGFVIIDEYRSKKLMEDSFKKFMHLHESSDEVKSLLRIVKGNDNLFEAFRDINFQRAAFDKLRGNLYTGEPEEILQKLKMVFEKKGQAVLISVIKRVVLILKDVNEIAPINKHGLKEKISGLLTSINGNPSGKEEIVKAVSRVEQILELGYTETGSPRKGPYLKNWEESFSVDDFAVLSEFKAVKDLLANANDEELQSSIQFSLTAAGVFDLYMKIYEDKKREIGGLDFSDLGIKVRELLRVDYVKSSLAKRFSYIMIDEYQDTNDMQYDIFIPMLRELQVGNLFIVGDEKQSIYMFRNADLEVFNRTKDLIIRKGSVDSDIVLKESFRMSPLLGLFANKVFEVRFGNPDTLYNESTHSEIICAKQDEVETSITFLLAQHPDAHSEETETPVDDAKKDPLLNGVARSGYITENDLIARKILELKKQFNLEWKDFAILARKNATVGAFSRLFPEYKIPFLLFGGGNFYESAIVLDISSYLDFLNDKSNDSALAALLKSPFFLFDDNMLFSISAAEGFSFYDKLVHFSIENTAAQRAVSILSKNQVAALYAGVSELITSIFEDTFYYSIAASRVEGEQILADIQKVISYALKFERDGYSNLYDFATFIRAAITAGQAESNAAIASGTDAVQVMTIHKSKGLQFKVVFLVDANSAITAHPISETKIYVDKDMGILAKLPVENNYFSEYKKGPVTALYEFIRNKKELAESTRVLYVALTRACDHLIISGTLSKKDGVTSSGFLKKILSVFNFELAENSEHIPLVGNILCLNSDDAGEPYIRRTITYPIPIVRQMDYLPEEEPVAGSTTPDFDINLERIPEVREIYYITATGFARYKNCALQYHLFHNLKMHKYIESLDKNTGGSLREENNEEVNIPERSDAAMQLKLKELSLATTRGSIMHKLLESAPASANVLATAKNIAAEMLGMVPDDQVDARLKTTVQLYNKFTKSNFYLEIPSGEEVYSEFNVSELIDDRILLQGVIDRIIFSGDTIHVYDWKTNRLTKDGFDSLTAYYQNQLLIYACIIANMFPGYPKVYYTVAYVNAPEKSVRKELTTADRAGFANDIKQMITDIETKNYSKNLNNCTGCMFVNKAGECVVNTKPLSSQ